MVDFPASHVSLRGFVCLGRLQKTMGCEGTFLVVTIASWGASLMYTKCHGFSVVVDVGMVGLMKHQIFFLDFSGPFGNVSHEILVSSQLIPIIAWPMMIRKG